MKKRLFTILKEQARVASPVLPTQKLEEFTIGKMSGIAIGTAILFQRLNEEEWITPEQLETLDCILSNRTVEDVRAERAEQEEMNRKMQELEQE